MTNTIHRSLLSAFFMLLSWVGYSQEVASIEFLSFTQRKDSLSLTYRLQSLPQQTLMGEGVFIGLSIESDSQAMHLPSILLVGKNKKRVLERYQHKQQYHAVLNSLNQDTVYTLTVPYAAWMSSANLHVRQELGIYRGKKINTSYKLALAPRLVQTLAFEPLVSYTTPIDEAEVCTLQNSATLDYRIGESLLDFSYKNNGQALAQIKGALTTLMQQADTEITGIHIKGFASPEGMYHRNEELARTRAQTISEVLQQSLPLSATLFSTSHVAEDWEGLVRLIEASSFAYKTEVLQTIARVGIHQGREAKLMLLHGGEPYLQMIRAFSPRLCRVEYTVHYKARNTNAASASHAQLYRLATVLGKQNSCYAEILLNLIPTQFAHDAVANNNAAALLLERGEYGEAKAYLQKTEPQAASLNNWGVYHLLQHNTQQAEQFFKRAVDAGSPEATFNLCELHRQQAACALQ